jgi:hypothetical protein
VKLEAARRYALSLPEVTEEPHHHLGSFRVKGKIFSTFPFDGTELRVFVDETTRDRMVVFDPAVYEPLFWGKKVVGLSLKLAKAKSEDVKELLRLAWQNKAPINLQGLRLPQK